MSNKTKKQKRARILLVLVVAIAIAVSVFFVVESNKDKIQIAEQSLQIDSLRVQNEFYYNLIEADEFFLFEENFNKTIEAYKVMLPQLSENNSEVVKKRIKELEEIRDRPLVENSEEDLRRSYQSIISRDKIIIDSLSSKLYISSLNERNTDSLKQKLETLKAEVQKLSQELNRKELIKVITFKSENGKNIHYLGEVSNGKANGGGVGIWSTGSIYRGDWKDNKRHGKGAFEWTDGVKYSGDYVNDKRDGQGTYSWPSGERYEGEWKNDVREGYGILYDQDGNIKFKGNWKDDKISK